MKRPSWFWIGFFLLLVIAAFDVTSNGVKNLSASGSDGYDEEFPLDESLLLSPAVSDAWSIEGTAEEWTEFVLDNPAGTVVIRAHDEGNRFRVRAWPVIYTEDSARANSALSEAELTIEVVDGVARPRFSLTPEALSWADRFAIVWEIELPAEVGVNVSTEAGRLSIYGMEGPVRARNSNGSTELRWLRGPVVLDVTSGRSDLEQLSGPLEIVARGERLSLMGVTGPVRLRSVETQYIYAYVRGDAVLDLSMAESNHLNPANTIIAESGIELNVKGGLFSVRWGGSGRLAITAERSFVALSRSGTFTPERSEGVSIHMMSGILSMSVPGVFPNHQLTLSGAGHMDREEFAGLQSVDVGRYEVRFGTGEYPAEIRIDAGAYLAVTTQGLLDAFHFFEMFDRDLLEE